MIRVTDTRAVTATRRGFTLIELLVVIAIIALLAAILFPVFARARENARRANCQSNQKQIGLGLLQYTQDYDERFPGSKTSSWGATQGWADQIQPYVKNTQILTCPSRRPATNVTYIANAFLTCGEGNGLVEGGTNCAGLGLSQSVVALPAQTIMVFEGYNPYDIAPTQGAGLVLTGESDKVPGNYGFGGDRWAVDLEPSRKIHLQGMNLLFADGHVKWYSEAKLLTLGVGTKPFCGNINGTGKNGYQWQPYKHNGDIDMIPLASTQYDP